MNPDSTDRPRANEQARQAWDQNAEFWDLRMSEGNDFVDVLIWPAVERLLALKRGERVLDIACGNGLTSRRMAATGCHVVAIDFSEQMIERARGGGSTGPGSIDYRVLDATNYDMLTGLGERSFDAALCNMEERAFPPGHPSGTHALSWGGNFSEIPPILVARMRIP
jgi:2-polyprenyl-3-methyl-5-hydroxy-6-metoxy-1,4-benzoquinol methylase